MSCPCDRLIHPLPRAIDAGLTRLPRQIAGFPEFREAMLAAIGGRTPLAGWRARRDDDLGVMLLEMWAYVCDVLAFYDEVIAHEAYLSTARRAPSLRRLVGLLGYRPRPAVAASVLLAARAQGRQPVVVPAGTAFRSGSFDGESPQVFELDAESVIHPLANAWDVAPPRSATLGAGAGSVQLSRLLFETARARAKEGDLLVIRTAPSAAGLARRVESVTQETAPDGARYKSVRLDAPFYAPAATPLADLEVHRPTRSADLWTQGVSSQPSVINSVANRKFTSKKFGSKKKSSSKKIALLRSKLYLDGLHKDVKAGDRIVVSRGEVHRLFSVWSAGESDRTVAPARSVTVDGTTIQSPAVTTPVTWIQLDANLNSSARKAPADVDWTDSHKRELVVRHGFETVGTLAATAAPTLPAASSLALAGPLETPEPPHEPRLFLLQDKDGRGVAVEGGLAWSAARLDLEPGTQWQPPLRLPVAAYGNALAASRGESVTGELLGSGDAALAAQTFKLAKKPLTYVSSPSSDDERGVASTLRVRVDGVEWSEVPGFLRAGPDDEVFIVRHDDAGETRVTFGDGERGRRLPTGALVTASYRFGAGAKSPPAAAIRQLARPVEGLASVHNPLPAAGGDDAEAPEAVRSNAPDSALILGRAVSIRDFEAVANGLPGITRASAEWTWSMTRQRPVVRIWYIGETGIEKSVTRSLRNVADPSIGLEVLAALALPLSLTLDLEIDRRYLVAEVLAAVRERLTDPATGLLAPAVAGIGRPLVRSRLFAAVLEVPGTLEVTGLGHGSAPFDQPAIHPGSGRYFDVAAGGLTLNGKETDGA